MKPARPVGNVDSDKDRAFLRLVEYLDNDEKSDGQYNSSELMLLMNSFLDDGICS